MFYIFYNILSIYILICQHFQSLQLPKATSILVKPLLLLINYGIHTESLRLDMESTDNPPTSQMITLDFFPCQLFNMNMSLTDILATFDMWL